MKYQPSPARKTRPRVCLWLMILSVMTVSPYLKAEISPPESDSAIYQKTRSALLGKGDYLQKIVTRGKDQTFIVECFASFEADFKTLTRLLSDFKHYPDWAFKNINRSLSGQNFLMKLENIKATPSARSSLDVDFVFDFPFFHTRLNRRFLVESENQEHLYLLRGKVAPEPKSLITRVGGEIRIFPAEKDPLRVWAHCYGTARVDSWLLFEAFPESVLNRVIGERIDIVINNYLDEEIRYRPHTKK